MGQVLIRNLDDEVLARLRTRAAEKGHSLEAELREILAEAARPSREELIAEADAIRAQSRPWRPGEPTIVDMLREDREGDGIRR